MKFFIYSLTIGSVMLFSCQSGNSANNKSQRFSNRLDTSYKSNSMDVDFVTRTFYQNGDYSSDKMILLQKKQDNNQNIIAVFKDDKDVTTVSFENGDGFLKFIEDAKTVLNNPDKNLDYSFGASKNGKINKGIEDGTITLYVNLFNSTTHNYVNNAELDSMKSCYNRFISESQK